MIVKCLAILTAGYGVGNFLLSVISTIYNCNDCPTEEKKPKKRKETNKKDSKTKSR